MCRFEKNYASGHFYAKTQITDIICLVEVDVRELIWEFDSILPAIQKWETCEHVYTGCGNSLVMRKFCTKPTAFFILLDAEIFGQSLSLLMWSYIVLLNANNLSNHKTWFDTFILIFHGFNNEAFAELLNSKIHNFKYWNVSYDFCFSITVCLLTH